MNKIIAFIFAAFVFVSSGYSAENKFNIYGSDKAPVTVYVYFSLGCFACGEFYKSIEPQLIKNYVDTGKIKMVLVDSPFGPPIAQEAHFATFAATNQKQYSNFVAALFANQKAWGQGGGSAEIMRIGVALGVNKDAMLKNINDKEGQQKYVEQASKEFSRLGLTGTPAVIIVKTPNLPSPSSKKMVGLLRYSQYEKAIDDMLK